MSVYRKVTRLRYSVHRFSA